MGLLTLGIGAGLGLAAYRNLPPITERTLSVVLVVWLVSVAAVWLQGRRHYQQQFQIQMQEQIQKQAQLQKQLQNQQQIIQVITADGLAGVALVEGSPATAELLDDHLPKGQGSLVQVNEVKAASAGGVDNRPPVVAPLDSPKLPIPVLREPNRDDSVRSNHV